MAAGTTSFTGSLHVNFGQDIVGHTLAFSANQPGLAGLTSIGQVVHIALGTIGGEPALIGYTGSDATDASARVFVVTLDSGPLDGAYSVTLRDGVIADIAPSQHGRAVLSPGGAADLVLVPAASIEDALARRLTGRIVFKGGR